MAREANSTKAKTVETGGLYEGTSPTDRARSRAATRATDQRKNQRDRTAKRGLHSSAQAKGRKSTKAKAVETAGLYAGTSPADRARSRAATRASDDKKSQSARTAEGGLHSSVQAKDRKSTKADKVETAGLYEGTTPADRAHGRADKRAGDDRKNQRKRDVTSPEYAAEQARKKQEAQAKAQAAEAKAKAAELKAKAAREAMEKLKGKARRAAREEAEKLEEEAKKARAEAKDAARQARSGGGDDEPASDAGAPESTPKDPAPKQPPVVTARKPAQVTDRSTPLTVASVVVESGAPVSVPPVVTRSASLMQATCTAQAWGEFNDQLAMVS